ncbi:MAG: serine hydrolase [Bacteroidetes bacterium]|nr:serine hydrolase [Bacteroidota bacterium]
MSTSTAYTSTAYMFTAFSSRLTPFLAGIIAILIVSGCSSSPTGPEAIPPDIQVPQRLNAVAGEPFTHELNVEDPQGLDVDILFEGLPAWLEYNPTGKILQGTPTAEDVGRTPLNIRAENQVTGRNVTTQLRVFATQQELGLQNHLEQSMRDITSGLLGVSVAIVDANGELHRAFSGNMGTSAGFPELQANSKYRVASVTKPMTAALILKLVDEGKISLTDFFENLYPSPLPNADRVTIHQMLTHTAGIYDHLNDSAFWSNFPLGRVWTTDQIIGLAAQRGAIFEPGTRYGYSNTGFCALGAVIEQEFDAGLRQAFDQQLFVPLGLENSVYDDFSNESNPIPNLAINGRSYQYHLTSACAAGAVAASAGDVAVFGWNLYGGRFVSEELTNRLSINFGAALGGQNYGYGTRIWNIGGIRHYGHTGNLMDYRNILMYVPGHDIAIAVHTHQPHASWSALTNSIFNYAITHFSDQPAKLLPLEMWINESRDDEQ